MPAGYAISDLRPVSVCLLPSTAHPIAPGKDLGLVRRRGLLLRLPPRPGSGGGLGGGAKPLDAEARLVVLALAVRALARAKEAPAPASATSASEPSLRSLSESSSMADSTADASSALQASIRQHVRAGKHQAAWEGTASRESLD